MPLPTQIFYWFKFSFKRLVTVSVKVTRFSANFLKWNKSELNIFFFLLIEFLCLTSIHLLDSSQWVVYRHISDYSLKSHSSVTSHQRIVDVSILRRCWWVKPLRGLINVFQIKLSISTKSHLKEIDGKCLIK